MYTHMLSEKDRSEISSMIDEAEKYLSEDREEEAREIVKRAILLMVQRATKSDPNLSLGLAFQAVNIEGRKEVYLGIKWIRDALKGGQRRDT